MFKKTLSCLILSIVACNPSPQHRGNNQSTNKTGPTAAPLSVPLQSPTITVTDLDGNPVEGAKVLIGNRIGQPFVNNWLQTDGSGVVTISTEWTSPVSVTVDHEGYMRSTYFNVSPRALKFKLRPLEKSEHLELSGTTNGFGNLEKNNIADFGMVIPSLSKRDLFAFSMDKIISPEMDVMEIAGVEAKVPSNVTFPRQRESIVFPITIEKERYRLYFNEPGTKKLYAVHGRFPFREVAEKISNKVPFQTLINYFQFVSGSLRDVPVLESTVVNFPVNELSFTSNTMVTPPAIASDRVMIAISLFEKMGYLYPTDMHKVEGPQAFSLKGLANAKQLTLSMLTRSSDFNQKGTIQEAMSAELVPQDPGHVASFINLIAPPQGSAQSWTGKIPEANGGIMPLTTYSVLSKVYRNGKQKTIVRGWEVFAENWIDSVELPEWPNGNAENRATPDAQRWEVTYIGTNEKLPLPNGTQLGPDVVDHTSHVSFNSVEF